MRDEISKYQKKLKLSNKLLEIYPSIDVETHEEFLLELLKALNEDREEKRRIRNLNSAGFSVIKTLDDYNYSQVQFPSSLKIQDLESLTFIERKENLILYGAVGTGKTHLSVALGVKAISQGKKAVFYRVHDLINQLEAGVEKQVTKVYKKIDQADLLILDEWDIYPFIKRGLGYCLISYLNAMKTRV